MVISVGGHFAVLLLILVVATVSLEKATLRFSHRRLLLVATPSLSLKISYVISEPIVFSSGEENSSSYLIHCHGEHSKHVVPSDTIA